MVCARINAKGGVKCAKHQTHIVQQSQSKTCQKSKSICLGAKLFLFFAVRGPAPPNAPGISLAPSSGTELRPE
jgi:hypothetical protein